MENVPWPSLESVNIQLKQAEKEFERLPTDDELAVFIDSMQGMVDEIVREARSGPDADKA